MPDLEKTSLAHSVRFFERPLHPMMKSWARSRRDDAEYAAALKGDFWVSCPRRRYRQSHRVGGVRAMALHLHVSAVQPRAGVLAKRKLDDRPP